MSLKAIVDAFNRKPGRMNNTGLFKSPYYEEDFENLSKSEITLLRQDIADGLLGYGYLKIGKEKVLGPPAVHLQSWIPKQYSEMAVDLFWEETLQFGMLADNTNIDYAVDVIAPFGLVKRCSLTMDPIVGDVQNIEFNRHSAEPLTLVDGYSRIYAAQSMLLEVQKKFGEDQIDYMIWLACVYDKDYIDNHPRSHEMKYVMVHNL
ncbi:hypothetical protein BDN70DRAFT_937695 [Pholiota conissans]|uniref:Uncharacterized protein n=1 Tax=Pholiota conissans TaxID=109636 RepID=A0A9P5YPH2_9AGAR|nr:hypothetical protein BDN70DRAFT_937695 [Pholiota conissans]